MPVRIRLVALAIAVLSGALPLAAIWADDDRRDHDHDLARELYEHGRIRSLADILREVRKHSPGDVVDVTLLPAGADWVYRIQVVGADGRRATVDVDAETAMPIDPSDSR